MADLNGMHVPDGRMYDIEQMCRVASGSVTILDFLLKDSDLRPFGGEGIMKADVENCNWYGVLRSGRVSQSIPASTRIIHVRQYHPDWRKFCLNMDNGDPLKWTINESGIRRWARHAVDRLSNWQGASDHHQLHADLFLDPRVAFSPFNEQDIEPAWVEYMQSVEWYKKIAATHLIWLDEMFKARPDRRCLFMTGALAGGHNPGGSAGIPDSEYMIPEMRDMLRAFDIVGGHCYGQLNNNAAWGMFGPIAKYYGLRLFRGMPEIAPTGTDLTLKDNSDPGGLVYQMRKLGKKVHVSESGTFRHADKGFVDENWRHMACFLDTSAKSNTVTGVDWFIWNSNSEHSGNRIWDSPGLRQKLDTAPRYQAAAWPVAGGYVPPITTTPPPVIIPPDMPPPTAEDFDPNPFGCVIFPGGEIYKQLQAEQAIAITGECRIPGDFAQIVTAVGVHHITGKRVIVTAWQDPAIRNGEWYRMTTFREP